MKLALPRFFTSMCTALACAMTVAAAPKNMTPPGIVAVPPEVAHALVIINGDVGSGTGFAASWKGKTMILTNAHVVSGNSRLEVVAPDGSRLHPTDLYVAVGHDVFMMMVDGLEHTLHIGETTPFPAEVDDNVLVAGNALGDGVFGGLPGRILGVGPERIEVDAQFVHGNSGSPIVLEKSGDVVGIATYAMVRKFDDKLASDSPFEEVRRFGYRLDSIREWQHVQWEQFKKEADELQKMEDLSDLLFRVAVDVRDGQVDGSYTGTPIEMAVATYRRNQDGSDILKSREAAIHLLDTARLDAMRDLETFQRKAIYDYHRRQAESLRPFREALTDYFTRMRGVEQEFLRERKH